MTTESTDSTPQSTAATPEVTRTTGAFRYDTSAAVAILTVMEIVVEHMNDIAKDIESSVLGVCGGFQGMSKRARQAVSAATMVLDDSGHEGGLAGAMHQIRVALATLLCRLEASRDFSIDLCERIAEMEERLDLVVRLGEKIMEMSQDTEQSAKQLLLPMRRTATGRTAYDQVWPEFETVTQTTQLLGKHVCGLVSGLRSLTKDSVNRAKLAAEQDQRAVQSSDSTIRITLEAISSSYERMNASLSSSSAMNNQLNLDIGQAVMSMQFQDRINQRIDHIVSTIHEIETDLKPITAHSTPENASTIAQLWTQRLAERSTMAAERAINNPAQAEAIVDIELF